MKRSRWLIPCLLALNCSLGACASLEFPTYDGTKDLAADKASFLEWNVYNEVVTVDGKRLWKYNRNDGIIVGKTPTYRSAKLIPGKHHIYFEVWDYLPNDDWSPLLWNTANIEMMAGHIYKIDNKRREFWKGFLNPSRPYTYSAWIEDIKNGRKFAEVDINPSFHQNYMRDMWPAMLFVKCHAAMEGFAYDRYDVATYFRYGYGIRKDNVQAQAWYNLAFAAGYRADSEYIQKFTSSLTREQISEADLLAKEGTPDHDTCKLTIKRSR